MKHYSLAAVIASVLVVCGGLAAADGEEKKDQKDMTVALRGKVGGIFVVAGKYADTGETDAELHAEGAIKVTYKPIGFEFGLGRLGSDAHFSSIKLTGTYEINPLAGTKGHEKQGNVYLGAGMGYYPVSADCVRYDGFGPHAVLGAEYFFNRVFGIYLEAQYTYFYFKPKDDGFDSSDLHGISGLIGFSLKF